MRGAKSPRFTDSRFGTQKQFYQFKHRCQGYPKCSARPVLNRLTLPTIAPHGRDRCTRLWPEVLIHTVPG